MKCEEALYDEGDTFSYRECQLDLGHPGDHDYFGQKYPRPIPSGELAPEVAKLIEQAARKANAWGIDDRKFPVVVEVTNVYVIGETGESEDDALKRLAYDPYHLDFSGEQAIDGSITVRRITDTERSDNLGFTHGPCIACPDCGQLADQRSWYHDPYRKCHGPIEWREGSAPSLRYRYSRQHAAKPVYDAARQAVTA